MTGRVFAEKMAAHDENLSYNVVGVNPEQSKHLETAVVAFQGHRLDFTHLRTELYTQNSRIPTIDFGQWNVCRFSRFVFTLYNCAGTPQQDALRRDCTINALYYNLDTRQMEDPCGLGIGDLSGGIIRTPTSPQSTLNDDPLRLLRIIRFAASLGFETHPDLRQAMLAPDVVIGLREKVSPERIMIEIDKIMQLHREGYVCALGTIAVIEGLLEVVFGLPRPLQNAAQLSVLNAEVERFATSMEALISARTATIFLRYNDAVSLLQNRALRRVWSNHRRLLVLRMVQSVLELQRLERVSNGPVSVRSLILWAREVGSEHWRIVMALTRVHGCKSTFPPEDVIERRSFMDPLVRGHVLAARYGN
jgi:tRNA nucleotidyltransferase/poly(A) polymerase